MSERLKGRSGARISNSDSIHLQFGTNTGNDFRSLPDLTPSKRYMLDTSANFSYAISIHLQYSTNTGNDVTGLTNLTPFKRYMLDTSASVNHAISQPVEISLPAAAVALDQITLHRNQNPTISDPLHNCEFLPNTFDGALVS
jgi:hypothetical protein